MFVLIIGDIHKAKIQDMQDRLAKVDEQLTTCQSQVSDLEKEKEQLEKQPRSKTIGKYLIIKVSANKIISR